MAYAVPSRVFALLKDRACPLMQAALQEAQPPVHEGATEDEIVSARRIMGITLALQALLQCDELEGVTDFDVVCALASVAGMVLAQVPEPRAHHNAFKAQLAAVLKEIVSARTPSSSAVN